MTNLLGLCVLAWMISAPVGAAAQVSLDLPSNAVGVDVEDRVGEFVPLDLIFEDERGNRIGLGKYFKQGKPIVLTLNYSDCPGLCIAQLDNLVSTLRELNGGGIGEDFEIVTVSIDPNETKEKALRTKSKYIGLLRGTEAEDGWHFLTGSQREITALADAVGFRYHYDKVNKRYNHPAVTYFVSSDGRICRYLLSLGVEPDQFKLALGEAREGKLTYSLADAIVQLCYLYNPDANRYSADARRILAFAAGAFAILLTGCTAPFWFTRKRKPVLSQGGGAASEQAAAEGHGTAIGELPTEPVPYNQETVNNHHSTET